MEYGVGCCLKCNALSLEVQGLGLKVYIVALGLEGRDLGLACG